jgi:hypothetical protein
VGRFAALLLATLALAGCGGAERGGGTATLWITRDRGAVLMVDAKVPAGQTLLRALRSHAKVDTRYGGRFVEAIDGVAGSLGKRHDWFWFVNGLAGDRSAAEYRLRAGDVAWWDYRDWTHDADLPVVVGAFPEPFLHGYGGKTRDAAIVYDSKALEPQARALGKLIHAKALTADEIGNANVLFLTKADVPLSATSSGAGKPVRFVIGPTAAKRLLADPKLVRFRYSGLP